MTRYDLLLLHASRASVDPVSEFYLDRAPELRQINLLDEGVMHRLKAKDWDGAVRRLAHLVRDAAGEYGIDRVLVTCSAIPPAPMMALREACAVPMLKIDEPMLEAAASESDGRVGLVATFPSTVETSIAWLRHFRPGIAVETECDAEALEALLRGERESHDERLGAAVRRIAGSGASPIVLAQVSMARLAPILARDTGARILESLSTSLDGVRRLGNGN